MPAPAAADDCFVALCLAAGIDLATTIADLNDFLRDHAPRIRQLDRTSPHLVAVLRAQTTSRRQALALPGAAP